MAWGSEHEWATLDCQRSDGQAIEEQLDRQLDDILDLAVVGAPSWLKLVGRGRHARGYEKVAGENIAVGELAENLDGGVEAEFFVELAQCCFGGRLAGVDRSARQTDLAGVTCKSVGTLGKR
jgi:hypothetical protein